MATAYTRLTNLEVTGILKVGGSFIPPEVAGDTFYVDVNFGKTTNDGLSWETPLKSLMPAIVLSNASIAAGASGWAARNRIYYKGDNNEAAKETLITLANKCDIIGVGSYDHKPYPIMIGNHVIGAGAYMGCRFINMGFQSLAAGGVIFTVPTTTSGLAFIGCTFDGRGTTPATKAIMATAVEQLSIIDCRFIGKYSTTTIDLGTGATRALMISGNYIESGAIGITVHASATCADAIGYIVNNTFAVTTLVIDENAAKFVIGDNRGTTLAADSKLTSVIDFNAALSYNNLFTCGTGVTAIYPAQAAITAP
jgi:hypothetical protein